MTLKITNPQNNEKFDFQVVDLEGQSSQKGKVLWARVGSRSYQFRTNENGNFSQKIVLEKGVNYIEVHDGQNVEQVDVIYQEEKLKRIWVELVWDTDETDIDLHVLEPDNGEVYYSDMESPHGGRLDVDDVDGFGPEHYTLGEFEGDEPLEGHYIVGITYFENHSSEYRETNCTVRWKINGGQMNSKKVLLKEPVPGDQLLSESLSAWERGNKATSSIIITELDLKSLSEEKSNNTDNSNKKFHDSSKQNSNNLPKRIIFVSNSLPFELSIHKSEVIGRDFFKADENSKFISKPQISIKKRNNGWFISENSDVVNKTYINGEALSGKEFKINNGDKLFIGNINSGNGFSATINYDD